MKRLSPEEKLARELFKATAKAIGDSTKWENAPPVNLGHWRELAKYVYANFRRKVKR